MSDSETDLFPSNIYTFRNESTTVSAKGPNITSTNITGLNFRSNLLSSTMQPRNFERQRYIETNCDQRSMFYRRETSPMSMYSGSDMRPRNYHNSLYNGGMSSQRSMYSGRGGSPVSMRSLDSNASVSAVDIAMAFKNVNFNRYDLRIIKDAYNKLMKRKMRKKIEKRRNVRLFLKGYRRKSGYDSGELGSDSSISSSDGGRSTNSVIGKDKLLSCGSTRTDITNFRQSIKESNMYNDCSETFKNNALKNKFSLYSSGSRDNLNSKNNMSTEMQTVPKTLHYIPSSTKSVPNVTQNVPPTAKKVNSVQNIPTTLNKLSNTTSVTHNVSTFNQRDRFKNSFLLPSQRFNKSIASVPIPEKDCALAKPTLTSNNEGKRNLDMEDKICSESKRKKISNQRPLKSASKQSTNKTTNVLKECNNNMDNNKVDDFEFVKPQCPVRKSGPGKVKEMLLSKSNAPLTEVINNPVIVPKEHVDSSKKDSNEVKAKKNIINEKQVSEQSDTVNQSTDVSMRPSFIKRKLFTQKMDVTENKNLSTEAININSPQTDVYSAIQREKHKTRKLVTNQSCLNRDINQEDNNLLDLIHKIVPPDRMNMTNVSNKTGLSSKNSQENKHYDEDKWDVTSIISTCDNDDVSDTYTDEDIFIDNNKRGRSSKRKDKPVKNLNPTNECRVMVEKIPKASLTKVNIDNKISVYNCAKVFWDTDFESDFENTVLKSNELEENHMKGTVNLYANNSSKLQDNIDISDLHNLHKQESVKQFTATITKEETLKKYNINKNLTIKAFGTPNIKTDNIVNLRIVGLESPKGGKKTTNMKQNISLPSKTLKVSTGNKNPETQNNLKNTKRKLDEPKVAESQNKIQTSKSTNNKTAKSKSAITPIPSNTQLNKTNVNAIVQRSHRTPKIKVCCDVPKKHKETRTRTVESKSKVNQNDAKGNNSKLKSKPAKKSNDADADKENTTKPMNVKKKTVPVVAQNIVENEPMNRTLRTRTIDLSSSFNTSNENITNITVKSLRSHRINLSSSMDDSTLEGKNILMKNTQKIPKKMTVKGKGKGL